MASGSEWQERANHRREFRQTTIPDAVTPGPAQKKKKTSRWCKGKVGVYHDWHEGEKSIFGLKIRQLECAACGKQKYVR